jgi:hypothetical protein
MDDQPILSTTPVYTLSITSELSGIPVYSIRQYEHVRWQNAKNVKHIITMPIPAGKHLKRE